MEDLMMKRNKFLKAVLRTMLRIHERSYEEKKQIPSP